MQDKIQLTATLEYHAKSVLFSDVSKYIRDDIADRLFEDTSDSLEIDTRMRTAGYEKLADAWDNDKINREDIISAIIVLTDQATAQYIDSNDIVVFTVTYILDLKKLDYAVDMREYRQKMSTDHYEQLLKRVVLYTSACNNIKEQLKQLTAMGFEEVDLRHFGFKDNDLAKLYEDDENETDIKLNHLDATLEDLDLSVRAYCCLKRFGAETVSDIIQLGPDELYNVRNLGKKAYLEIIQTINKKCGIDMSDWARKINE